MRDLDRPLPPHSVPTLTEVVLAGDQPVRPPSGPVSAAMHPVDDTPLHGDAAEGLVEDWLHGLQDDLTQFLAARLNEQVPYWAAQWVQGMQPELKALAQKMAEQVAIASVQRAYSDRDKP